MNLTPDSFDLVPDEKRERRLDRWMIGGILALLACAVVQIVVILAASHVS